jgi:glycosyltransferase involved in cell wall biosynthesis
MNIFNNMIHVGEQNIRNKDDIVSKNDNNSWWHKSTNNKTRIMLCGTYPIGTSNGYSKVVYYICKYLQKYDDIQLTVYGFQNVNNTNGSNIRNDLDNVILYDVLANENPKRNGFGEKEIGNYLKKNPQDIIIIFNDSIITTALVGTLVKECWNEKKNFKLVSYMDQVYKYQKKEYIQILNTFFDGIITFTPYWQEIAKKLGITKPLYNFPHGFDYNLYYPIPQTIARLYYNYNDDDFIILNLNRNQPRKRWDISIIAWANFLVMCYNKFKKISNLKLVVGTQMNGYWDLMEVFYNEIRFTEIPWEDAKNTIVEIDNPQKLSDRDINILYNSCDIGLNTADGEGFGLCTFEGLGVGKPQVASYLGGMIEFLSDDFSFKIEPKSYIYLDHKSVGIGGKAELISPHECAEIFFKYYMDRNLLKKHGENARKHILTHYRWETLVEYFYKNIIKKI